MPHERIVPKHSRTRARSGTQSHCYGHSGVNFVDILCGDYASANTLMEECTAFADEKNAALWKAFAMMGRGWLQATGSLSDAVQTMTAGVTAMHSGGATVWTPIFMSELARAYAELGQAEEARRYVGETITMVETTKQRWFEAEVNRVAGEIALMSPEPDATKAEAYFERALAIARQQQAKRARKRKGFGWTRCDTQTASPTLRPHAPDVGISESAKTKQAGAAWVVPCFR